MRYIDHAKKDHGSNYCPDMLKYAKIQTCNNCGIVLHLAV